ncbi:MAG: hypothetical protein NT130_05575 [Candidatus Micrarchaeota archaeon]|nr:hypothetical protein [Candidatus Micrarchaeota archaeon]
MGGSPLDGPGKKGEEAFAEFLSKAYSEIARVFKDRKMEQFENMAKAADSNFQSLRQAAFSRAKDCKSASSLTEAVEDDVVSMQSAFIKEYQSKEMDDDGFFTGMMYDFRQVKYRLALYRGFIGALGAARAALEKAGKEDAVKAAKDAGMREVEAAKEEYRKYVTEYDQVASKLGNGDITDVSSTIMRYFDLSHEALVLEVPNKSSENPRDRILRLTGSKEGELSNLRSKAYHAKSVELEKLAAAATIAFNTYRGAFAALFVISELG